MKQKDQRALCEAVKDYVLRRGGELRESEPDYRDSLMFIHILVIETIAGPLTICPLGNWIATCFDDVGRAASSLPPQVFRGVNQYSGKWNFHFHSKSNALDALATFAQSLNQILLRED